MPTMDRNSTPYTFGIPPRYPDRIAASIPLGLKERARRAAEREGVALAEFVRKALEARLTSAEAR